MKSPYLAPVAFAALLFAYAIANAQAPPTPSAAQSAMPPTSQANTTKGNVFGGYFASRSANYTGEPPVRRRG